MLITAAWLRELELRPTFAALVPLFLPASVLGRTGMSDLPSAAVVVASLFLLARAPERAPILGGGFLAGLSLAFRDSTPVFTAPAILRCLLRRERVVLLMAAILAGVAARLCLAALLQGDALALRAPYVFNLSEAAGHALLYGFALTILVPGGLLAVALYRGPLRMVLILTVVGGFIFFSFYFYAGQYSGFFRSLVLGPRYVLPLVPLLAIALASLVDRVFSAEKTKRGIELCVLGAAALVTCVVHPALHTWSERQAKLVRALYETTSADAVLVTEPGATEKYLNGLYGQRTFTDRLLYPPKKLRDLLARGPVQLVFIDRRDSEYWRSLADLNDQYLASASDACELRPRLDITSTDRLRIVDVVRCH